MFAWPSRLALPQHGAGQQLDGDVPVEPRVPRHPNICTIHEINETDDDQLYLVMAHYEGETLKERISRGPLELNDAIDIATQVGEGLAEAHAASIMHRDIKPANLLVTKTGVVKILDFGLAKLAGSEGVTQTGTTVGTVAYMSPEQARGEEVDHRTDIWSLGCLGQAEGRVSVCSLPAFRSSRRMLVRPRSWSPPKEEYSPFVADHFPTDRCLATPVCTRPGRRTPGMIGGKLGPEEAYGESRGETITSLAQEGEDGPSPGLDLTGPGVTSRVRLESLPQSRPRTIAGRQPA